MTDVQLGEIRRLLENELSILERSELSLEMQFCADENELASRVSELNMSVGMHARQSHRLRQVEDAIKRMDCMCYGICDECGEDIAVARLKANPVTCLCISCQKELEREIYSRTG